ncbi:hypothetical protein M6I34_07695 [Burkholderiaceae bacterium FT117]|uniref:hypothetical protein n=1 Tax=Zeimonas sediminis TaxID=2944268 RepID=UPI0023430A0B|nr:hypothetical protein [Zeimonas sediminis]MCM5570388.1 hypothetical protein [Zeimonas sediminis]
MLPLAPFLRALAIVLAVLALPACRSLLPDAHEDTLVEWKTFDDAKAAIDAIEPFKTTRAELAAQGIDPLRNPAITVLSYPDVVQRFSPGAAVLPHQLDPGVLACLKAAKTCTGYAIAMRRIKRDRTGNFWLDSFNFNREVTITGWTFNATVLFVDGLAVFAVYGGQPAMHERQVTRNPLGPLQGWGDALRPR